MAETPFIQRRKTENPLHDLLLESCVPDSSGKKSITVVARHAELSTESVHKWVRNLSIPPHRAEDVVALYETYRDKAVKIAETLGEDADLREIVLEEFFPYIFKNHS